MKRNLLDFAPVAIISFITHSSHLNYGATLHGYAFQQYLLKEGVNSVVIDYLPRAVEGDNLKYPILNDDSSRSLLQWIAVKFNWLLGFSSNLKRFKKFNLFLAKYIKKTERIYTYNDLRRARTIEGGSFSIFVCESDVIWKVLSIDSIDENFFLDFPAADGCRKVAYAPSISAKILTGSLLERFKELVIPFDAISAREKMGSEYLTLITGKHVTCVLDPTLLLERADYDIIAQDPKEEKYILVYNVTENDIKMVKEAMRFGKLCGLKVIEISNYAINELIVPHRVIIGAGIEEWIGYVKNADIVITNSFHGFCFSIIYHRNVYLFQRNNEDYKMQHISNSLGLESRLIGFQSKVLPSHADDINWEEVDERLNNMRIESKKYIQENIIAYCKRV